MSDVMLLGVLRMPYELAMADELSRLQYWQRVQQAADELTSANERIRELARKMAQVNEMYARTNLALTSEREISDNLEKALQEAIDRHDNPRLGIPDRAAHIVTPLRAALAEVEAIREKEKA